MPGRRILVLGFAGIAACGRVDTPGSRCLKGAESFGDGDRSYVLRIDDPALEGPLVAQLFVPWEDPRWPEGSPAVVFAHGGWAADAVPVSADEGRMSTGQGLAVLYLNLPGGPDPQSSPGTDDRRGPNSRQGVGAALRYAAGAIPDVDGCTIGERAPGGVAPHVALAGYSNGGNLAWATLADPEVDLPDLAGVATFETPISGQFSTAEIGTAEDPSPLYREGSCGLDEENAVVCDWEYAPLAFDATADDATSGKLFLDEEEDGGWDEGVDFELGAILSKSDERWMHSLPAREAADGLDLLERGTVEETRAFWAEREAPRAMPAAAARFPALAGIAVGTEEDHILTGAGDHPHVTGLVAAMQSAGIAWTRVHPDAAYARAVAGLDRDFADVAANTTVTVGDPSIPMEPEDDEEVQGGDYLTAAALEILDRARAGEWSADVDAVLAP